MNLPMLNVGLVVQEGPVVVLVGQKYVVTLMMYAIVIALNLDNINVEQPIWVLDGIMAQSIIMVNILFNGEVGDGKAYDC